MDYKKHYEILIFRARGRVLEGYIEKHHIIPRCIGGRNTPKNIVDLTPEEHYVAHQLLVKMYPRGSQERRKLIHAANLMSHGNRYQNRGMNKLYGWLRREHAAEMSKKMTGVKRGPLSDEHKQKLSETFRGKTYEEIHGIEKAKELRKIRSKAKIGNTHGLGKKCKEETKEKIRKKRTLQTFSKETRIKMSRAKLGKLRPDISKRMRKPITINGVEYLSCKEAARKLQVHTNTITKWIKNGIAKTIEGEIL